MGSFLLILSFCCAYNVKRIYCYMAVSVIFGFVEGILHGRNIFLYVFSFLYLSGIFYITSGKNMNYIKFGILVFLCISVYEFVRYIVLYSDFISMPDVVRTVIIPDGLSGFLYANIINTLIRKKSEHIFIQ